MSKILGIIFIVLGSVVYKTFIDPNIGVIGSIIVSAISGGLGGLLGGIIDSFIEKKKFSSRLNESKDTNDVQNVVEESLNFINKKDIPTRNNKNKYIYLFSVLIVALIALFIYPTLYYYDKLDKYPVKINRVTGYSEILTVNGWESLGDPEIKLTIGSTKNDVKKVLGEPWYTYKFPDSEMWYYKISGKSSSIEFKNSKVVGWKDADNILKIK